MGKASAIRYGRKGVSDRDLDLIQGTLNVVILRTLAWRPMNGYAIAQWVREMTEGEIAMEEGALYPALHRMEHRKWITAEWGLSENNRRAKFYRLTPLGRRVLQERVRGWERLVAAMGRVLQAQPAHS
jgi:PadR family transcriptional regulator, regulatory protein PadR